MYYSKLSTVCYTLQSSRDGAVSKEGKSVNERVGTCQSIVIKSRFMAELQYSSNQYVRLYRNSSWDGTVSKDGATACERVANAKVFFPACNQEWIIMARLWYSKVSG